MKILSALAGGAALSCAISGLAQAQVTQTYTYDGNGRIVGVATNGGSGVHTSSYAYDDADNRTQRVRSGTGAYAALTDLPLGGVLAPDEALVSPDGRSTFALRSTGRLEVWRGGDAVWAPTSSQAAPSFELASTGAARLRLPPTLTLSHPARLALRDDSRLVLRAEDGAVLWLSDIQAQ